MTGFWKKIEPWLDLEKKKIFSIKKAICLSITKVIFFENVKRTWRRTVLAVRKENYAATATVSCSIPKFYFVKPELMGNFFWRSCHLSSIYMANRESRVIKISSPKIICKYCNIFLEELRSSPLQAWALRWLKRGLYLPLPPQHFPPPLTNSTRPASSRDQVWRCWLRRLSSPPTSFPCTQWRPW